MAVQSSETTPDSHRKRTKHENRKTERQTSSLTAEKVAMSTTTTAHDLDPSRTKIEDVSGPCCSLHHCHREGHSLRRRAHQQCERTEALGVQATRAVCRGWFGMMDDESRACQEQQHTFSQCQMSHGVLLVALAEVTGMDQVTCKGVGVSSSNAQMDSNDI